MRNIFNRKKHTEQDFGDIIALSSLPKEIYDFNVSNISKVLKFTCADAHRSIRLTSTMKTELTTMFGKYLSTHRGEFLFYIWRLEFEGRIYRLYTANNYGTTISVEAEITEQDSPALAKDCIRFLTKLDSELEKIKLKP